ncbi:hypothetical protein QQF64_020057 [Cirrhinus molitorella]|uniref:Uncharacterized protein n=1 Tax=Cirrhinus molitorella TaxID=172907 RepID=A0ABR3LH99_9TELE
MLRKERSQVCSEHNVKRRREVDDAHLELSVASAIKEVGPTFGCTFMTGHQKAYMQVKFESEECYDRFINLIMSCGKRSWMPTPPLQSFQGLLAVGCHHPVG